MARLEISRSALAHNIACVLARLDKNARFISILKDNAYGHGAELLAPFYRELGVNMCAVKNESEAAAMGKYFDDILVLSQPAASAKIGPFIYAINELDDFKFIKNAKIMLKIDTGMRRSGIKLEQIRPAIEAAKAQGCELLGAFTHYSSVAHIDAQQAVYEESINEYLHYAKKYNQLSANADKLALSDELSANLKNLILESAFLKDEQNSNALNKLNTCSRTKVYSNTPGAFFHSAASFGVFAGAGALDNAARVGLAQFGYAHASLKPAAKLYARRLSSRTLEPGDVVGYDETFCADKKMTSSNYDLGYADGLAFYNGDNVLKIAGARVLGRFSMDSFSLESCDDEVCFFDDAKAYADAFNISTYEALVRLGAHLPRVLVD